MSVLSAEEIARYAYAAGFRGHDLSKAVAVAFAESGGDPGAINQNTDRYRSKDYGLWQINDHYWTDLLRSGSWSNPADNARMAFTVYKQQGWNAWYGYKNGGYHRFMLKAIHAANGVSKDSTGPVPVGTEERQSVPAGTGVGNGRQFLTGLVGGALVLFGLSRLTGVSVTSLIPAGKILKAVKA